MRLPRFRAVMADPKPAAGQVGPRMLGRLTPELILRSPQYMNPVNLYEIDLRANRVAAIENLGATEVRVPPLRPRWRCQPGRQRQTPSPPPLLAKPARPPLAAAVVAAEPV